MSIPANCMRVSLTGTSPQAEIFDTSFWVTPTTSATVPTDNASAALAATAIATTLLASTFMATLRAFIPATASYQSLKVYSYPTGGPTAVAAGQAPLVGAGNGLGSLPLQTCAVLSLRTGQIGRSFRGRMYLPAYGIALTANQIPDATGSVVASRAATFFDSLISTNQYKPVIMSKERSALTAVTSLVFDSRCDIQRRRANRETVLFTYNQAL